MTSFLRAINDYVVWHKTNIPSDTGRMMIISGLTSYTYGAVFRQNAIEHAVFGVLVSLVNSLTMPFFKKVFQEDTIDWWREGVRITVVWGVTQSIVNYVTPYKVDLLSSAFLIFIIRFVRGGSTTYSLNESRETIG